MEREFASLFAQLSHYPRPFALRKKLLASSLSWRSLRTNLTCLFCLLRGTSDVLPCGHAICPVCVCRYGERARAEYHFDVTFCIICRKSFDYTIRLLPATKRPNILVLDGGGIRGVITLGFLRALEQLGSLREHFNLTVGTSAGK